MKLFVVVLFFLIGSSLRAVTKEVLEVVPASRLNVNGGIMEIIVTKSSKS